jgi:hypothetical protein
MKHLKRTIATIVVGLYVMLGLPGIAYAHTEPIRPESTTVPLTTSGLQHAPASAVSSAGWSPALVVAVVLVVTLAVGIALVGQRVARNHRGAHTPAVGV